MKGILFSIITLLSISTYAQNVGVGTAAPAAKLDVTSSNSGILIPRVVLTSTATAAPVSSPVTSMMVYNSNTAGAGATAVTPGYYYWNGSAWVRVIDNNSVPNIYTADGSLTGNRTVTMAADNLTLSSTTGNLIFSPSSTGRVGIGTAGPLSSLDVNGTALIRGTNTNTAATPVSAVELLTGRSNTSGLVSGQTNADIAIQYGGGGYRHFISTRHNAIASSNQNAIDFYLNNSTTAAGSSAPGTGSVQMMSITATGVGIGTLLPDQALTVTGNIDFPQFTSPIIGFPTAVSGNHGTINIQAGSNVYSGSATAGGNISLTGGNSNVSAETGAAWGGNITIKAGQNVYDGTGGGEIAFQTGGSTATERMRIKAAGTVGISPNASYIISSYPAESDLILGAAANGEGGQLQLNQHPGYSIAYFIDVYQNSMRILSGTNAGSSTQIAQFQASASYAMNQTDGTVGGGGIDEMDEGQGQHNVGNTYSANLVAIINGSMAVNGQLFLSSDERIKRDISQTDNHADLATIKKVQVSNYRYIDTIANGARPQKKLIAQQVKSVYPQAVTSTSGFIPNIFAMSLSVRADSNELTITMPAKTTLAVNDNVRFYVGNDQHEAKVIARTGNSFTVANDHFKLDKPVFVYGFEVSDFMKVDYDAISMLNVSATQELSKMLDAEKDKNAVLQARIALLEQQNSGTKADMNKLKASIETLQQIVGAKAQK
jgi:hypothetical protein